MELQLKGKTAMVAAASKGLGFGIARELAREGANVSMASRNISAIAEAARDIAGQTGAKTLGCVMDAKDLASIESWIEKTISEFGQIDMLVVNAGGPPPGTFDQLSDADWHSAFELTFLSTVRMIRAVLPSMRKAGGGSILTVTSSVIKEPLVNLLLSNAMRSGVAALLKSLSMELASENIRIVNLAPGRIDTERLQSLDKKNAETKGISFEEQRAFVQSSIPLGRYGTIEEFGRAAAFLLSPAASYITGEILLVDGGLARSIW